MKNTENEESEVFGDARNYQIVPVPETNKIDEEKESGEKWKKIEKAFGPIVGGMVIDFVDLATFGPVGLYLGIILGTAAGYWVTSIYQLPPKKRWLWSLLAGVYCALPLTGIIPFATLLGAYVRYISPNN